MFLEFSMPHKKAIRNELQPFKIYNNDGNGDDSDNNDASIYSFVLRDGYLLYLLKAIKGHGLA